MLKAIPKIGRVVTCVLRLGLIINALTIIANAQQHVSFPTDDGGTIHADLYGTGERGVVLAHGGRFNK